MTFDWSQLLDEINGLFIKTTRDKIFKNEKDDFLKHVQTCLKLNDSEDWNYILASEDIGLANPNALLLATSCFQAVTMIGYPEARIILSEAAIYLANSAKSNSAYSAIDEALELVKNTGDLPVPLHIRNAPTKLMKDLGYGKNYKYAHSYEGNFVDSDFLPEKIKKTTIYKPQENAREKEHRAYLSKIWKDRYDY